MTISVCIPTYNQSQYLAQAIRSTYNQSVKPIEIIVSNDCSTDDTLEILEMLSNEIPILKIISQQKNLGITYNTDYCLRLAKGDFIVRLDSDDYLSFKYIEKLSALLIKYPEAGYAHAAVQEIDQNGNYLNKRQLARKSGYQNSTNALQSAIKGYRVAANIIMFRREALVKVDFLNNRPNSAEDYHLSASLAAAGYGNVYLNEILSFYRVWVDSGKARLRRKLMEIIGMYKVFHEVLEPAYKERNWNLKSIYKNRTHFACVLADCLSWNVYSNEEKIQLKDALRTLSSSPKAKAISWLYLNGYGKYLDFYSTIAFKLFSNLKATYIKFRY
ncbi:glycosyltransferase family 2 protein [Mucilaginibacter arboris]|uniref:Glycosyltransferase n=1 Tax=Mucilaginibacter arboris TaxID=2682090 RepID=A0A7K1SY39_9SPHI|nr:glycosyltransferase family 2 protein [Mucilaginibacter arboris]MVN22223.1 glycosyltransferase [Mucilaginibacter arboris]